MNLYEDNGLEGKLIVAYYIPKTIVEMANNMLHEKKLPYYLWGKLSSELSICSIDVLQRQYRIKLLLKHLVGRSLELSISKFFVVFVIVTLLDN